MPAQLENRSHGILMFLFALLISVVEGYWVAEIWFEAELEREAATLEKAYSRKLLAVESAWKLLDDKLAFDCSHTDLALMLEIEHHYRFVDDISLHLADGTECRSHDHKSEGHIKVKAHPAVSGEVDYGVSGVDELIVKQVFEKGYIQLHLEEISIKKMLTRYCEACIYLEMQVNQSGGTVLAGSPAVKDLAERSLRSRADEKRFQFTLYFSQELHWQFLRRSFIPIVTITLLGTLLIVIVLTSIRYFNQRSGMSAQVEKGLKNREFIPYYQPIIDIDAIGTEDVKRPVLDSIVEFARKADLNVVAEGVETLEQVKVLKQLEVHLIQGFYFAKPMPFSDYVNYKKTFKLTDYISDELNV